MSLLRNMAKLCASSQNSGKIQKNHPKSLSTNDLLEREPLGGSGQEQPQVTYFRIRWGDGTRLFRVEDSGSYRDAEHGEAMYFLGRPLDPHTGEWAATRQRVYTPDVVNWNAKW
jgi:hypothetical protein